MSGWVRQSNSLSFIEHGDSEVVTVHGERGDVTVLTESKHHSNVLAYLDARMGKRGERRG